MHRFTRALGALVVAALVAAGLVVGLSTPSQARGLLPTLPDTLQVVSPPVLTGTGAVGSPLDVTLPVWNAGGTVTNTVAWFNSAGPIAGATSTSYTPTAGDAGGAVVAVVTGHLLNLVPVAVPTNAVPVPIDGGDPGEPGDPAGDALSLVSGLELPASAEVGQLIVLTDPVWSLPGVTTTYQWLRDGTPIPGADDPFYVPTPDDAGHQVSAAVTGTLLGVPAVTVVTGALGIPLTSGSAVSPVGDVTVNGTRKIGTVLSLSGPTWDPADATNKYQWLRDESPISGATGPTYTLVPADLGHGISVKVTGHKAGWTDSTITSDPVSPVVGDAIQFLVKPRITGTAKVGRLLTADPGVWGSAGQDGAAPAFSYQWSRNGVALPGAVAQTYQVAAADAGRSLTVTVKAIRPAYKAGTFTTANLAVAKIVPTLRVTAAKSSLRKGQRAILSLRLYAPGVASPTGAVTIYDGRKVVKKVTVAPHKRGRATVRLAGLTPGAHRLKAVYAGSASVARTTSKVVKVTVRKR